MKLTYWHIPCLRDSVCYSIRAKTKREALQQLSELDPAGYGAVEKVTVDYADGFDLVVSCLSEGGAYWERATAKPARWE